MQSKRSKRRIGTLMTILVAGRTGAAVIVAVTLLWAASGARAVPLGQYNNGWAPGTWQGTLPIPDSPGGPVLTVNVDYSAFKPGFYPGVDPSLGLQYVYAYQVFNLPASTVALTAFSVGLDPLAVAVNPGADNTIGVVVPPGITPDLFVIGSSSARWGFGWIGGAEVNPNQQSTVVLFTSPGSPKWETCTTMDGGVPTPAGLLPSPIPEPGTITLISVGGLAILLRRRRRRGV